MGETIVNTGSEGLLEILRFGGNQEDSSPVSGWVFHPAGKLSKATRKHVHTPHPLILPTFSMNRHGMWKDDAHQAACRTAELSHI